MKLIAFEGYSMLSPNGYYQILPIEDQARLLKANNSKNKRQIVQGLSSVLFLEV
jgi:hypothetical protein